MRFLLVNPTFLNIFLHVLLFRLDIDGEEDTTLDQ